MADEPESGALEEWLAREVSSDSGGIDLSEEDRERARELVNNDPELAELAAQYADESGGEEPAFDQSGVLGAVQRRFFADVQRYRTTRQEYRTAREQNQTERERRLAHELERHAAAVNQSAQQLNRSYVELESVEQDDLEGVTRTINQVRDNVTASQQTVRNQTLVRTQLSVRATDPSGSFTDPVSIAGGIQSADGSPLANETVTLLVDGQVQNATTDSEGQFEIGYRPTATAVGNHSRTIWFLPANDSAYLRASDTAQFAVERVSPNLTITNRTETVSYDEILAVNGTAQAGGDGVPDVPVAVTVDNVSMDIVRTGPNGSFGVVTRLPGNVSTGDQQVRVQLAFDEANRTDGRADRTDHAAGLTAQTHGWLDRSVEPPNRLLLSNETESSETESSDRQPALASANASARVAVESTPTVLSINEVELLDQSTFVAGRLLTQYGAPLANQTVALRVDGTPVGTALTNENGDFAATVGLPSNESDRSSVRVVAEFPSPGNLESTRANETVKPSASEDALPLDPFELGVAGLLGIAAVGVAVWRFRSNTALSLGSRRTDTDLQVGETGASGPSPEAFLDAATAALDDESYDAAVGAAYASVRRRLDSQGEPIRRTDTGTRTHWEFYDDCRTVGLPDDHLDELERLTETYERAAFAPEVISASEAEAAVEIAQSFADERNEFSAD